MIATLPRCASEPQRGSSNSETTLQLRKLARQLVAAELNFIYHADFSLPNVGDEIMSAIAPRADGVESQWKPDRSMPAYLARLCEAKLLKHSEETALFRRMNYCKYKADCLRRTLNVSRPSRNSIERIQQLVGQANADRDRLVRANLRLVISIAKKFTNPRVLFDDLVSEGIGSLLRAVEKFDFDRGFRFSTYATQAIRRTLCRQLQNAQRDGSRFVTSDTLQLEPQAEEQTDPGLREARWEQLRGNLKRLLARLDPRERAIIRRRFGLDHASDVQTLQSLAHEMGVCKERVRQLEVRAIAKLRALADQGRLPPPE
jgi:RNA polymerase primary sigma factor